MSDALQELIRKGLSLVEEEPQHDLKLGFRCHLLSAFNEIGSPEGRRTSHRKKVKLAVLAVTKVLPLWEGLFATDRTPHHALELAEKTFAETISPTTAEKEVGRLWTHCDDLIWKHEGNQSPIMVGYGAIQAIREALSERHFGRAHVNDQSTDLDIQPYDQDSSFFAAAAYSNGAPWESKSNAQQRLEFWTWWLMS